MHRVCRLLPRHTRPHHSTLSRPISRTMQGIKVGWASRTFALAAKSNDKVEKKSGVRLSKKDRRVMVESFIKTYQKLNNGSFPSIHITHKEVGGSYYIVREIVRDIIQENKVLAPPKALHQDHKMFNSPPGSYPFRSISMESQVSSTSLPNGVQESYHGVPKPAIEELTLESEKLTDDDIDKSLYIGLNASLEKPEELVQEDLVVNESLVRGFEESKELELVEKPEEFILDSEKLADQYRDDDLYIGLSAPEKKPEELVREDLGVKESMIRGLDGSGEFKLVETIEQEELAANEPAISSNTSELENINGMSSVSVRESRKEASATKHEALQSTKSGKDDLTVKSAEQEATKNIDEAVEGKTDHHMDRKPTSDKTNLEPREEVSRKPAHEVNPILGFVKTCVTAFAKLFSK